MDELEQQIREWQAVTFPHATRSSVLAHLKRECQEFLADKQPDEAADIVHMLVAYAALDGWELIRSMYDYPYIPAALKADVDFGEAFRNVFGSFLQEPTSAHASYIMYMLDYYGLMCGWSLKVVTRAKFEVNLTRTWGKPDHEGVVEHIKE